MLVDLDDLKKEIAARQKKQKSPWCRRKNRPRSDSPSAAITSLRHRYLGLDARPNTDGLWASPSEIGEVLDVYPQVDAAGAGPPTADSSSTASQRRDGLLPDTRDTRDNITRTLRRYNAETISNPVPGIYRAITTLYDANNPAMKMGIYASCDEFSASDHDGVMKTVDQLNPPRKRPCKIVINWSGSDDNSLHLFHGQHGPAPRER